MVLNAGLLTYTADEEITADMANYGVDV